MTVHTETPSLPAERTFRSGPSGGHGGQPSELTVPSGLRPVGLLNLRRASLTFGLLTALTFPAAAQATTTQAASTAAVQTPRMPTWTYGFLLISNGTSGVKFSSVSFNTPAGSMFAPTIEALMDKLGAPRSGKPDRAALLELYGWLGAEGWELVQCQPPTPDVIEIERCIFKRPT